MKILIIVLGLLNGCYMLLDGIFVVLKGKYIGPEKPGPWAFLFYKLNVDVFKLGPLFILCGVLWIIWAFMMLTNHSYSLILGLILSVATLWYLPAGTIFSVIILITLIMLKQKA